MIEQRGDALDFRLAISRNRRCLSFMSPMTSSTMRWTDSRIEVRGVLISWLSIEMKSDRMRSSSMSLAAMSLKAPASSPNSSLE